jgi:ABC-type nitrate/sulfonate/bicarbonate transport system substrate-binding protein
MKRNTFGLACLAVLAVILVGAPAMTQTLDKVKVIIPQNSAFVLNWVGGAEAGVFKKHGIDIDVDVRPFAGFLAGMPSKASMVGTYSGMDAVEKMNQGVDWAVIGGGLTVFHGVFVPKDSPIKTVADLKGKKFGVWSTGAGTYKAVRVALIDAHGIDIAKDTKIVQLAPPALFKLLERGDIDAMLNISSFTVRAMSQPDKLRSLFDPNAYWKKKTGYPIVWTAPLVAWKSWVKENPDRAKRVAAATMESFVWLRKPENLEAVVKKHGKLAGVTDPAAVGVYKKLLADELMFLTEWNQKSVDSQWQFLELAKKSGVLDKVPPKAEHALLVNK